MKIRVIGMGFAGSACSLLLSRQGHQVELFEKTAEPGAVGAGILLQPSGQSVLEKLDLMSKIRPHCHRISALQARNQRGKRFLDLSLTAQPTYGVRRGVIFEALYSALRQSQVELHLGQEVREVGLRDDDYDFTVIADGSRSQLRQDHFTTSWRQEYEMGALWFCSSEAGPSENLHQVSWGTHRLCGFLPTQPGCSFFWACSPDEFSSYTADHFMGFRRIALRLAPEGSRVIRSLQPEQVLFARYRHAWVAHWQREKLVLLGDAAHPMSPHLGQGVNLALLDAYSLAKSLPDVSRYCRVRQRHLRLYSSLSYLLTPFFQSSRDWGISFGRDLALPLMLRWPWMAEQMRLAVYGQKGGWWTGAQDLEQLT